MKQKREKVAVPLDPTNKGKAEVEVSREALAHLLTIYELAQASLFADGEISPGGEFYDRLVDAADDERNVEWGIEIRAALAKEDTNG